MENAIPPFLRFRSLKNLSPNMGNVPCEENNDKCFPNPKIAVHNDDAKDYGWNGIVLLAAIVSILIVFIITIIAYNIYFHLYSNRLQRELQRRPRRRRIILQRHRFSWRIGHDYHFRDSSSDQGLCNADVEALPVFVYKAVDFSDPLRCAVCLCEFEENENGRVLPNCGHRFHVDCIDMWFYSHSTCPLCRKEVGAQPENGHVVVEVSNGREENGDRNEKVVESDASASAELEDKDSHCSKDFEAESRVDIPIRSVPMER